MAPKFSRVDSSSCSCLRRIPNRSTLFWNHFLTRYTFRHSRTIATATAFLFCFVLDLEISQWNSSRLFILPAPSTRFITRRSRAPDMMAFRLTDSRNNPSSHSYNNAILPCRSYYAGRKVDAHSG